MKVIPLIQKADVQSINTSIIALKEAQKELETLNIQVNRKISDLNKLLDGLDVAEIGGSGKLIQSIKQTDGKISATSVNLTSTIASGNNQPATSGGVADAKYTTIFTAALSVSGWYKITNLSPRAYGSSVMIDLYTVFNYQYCSSHKIQINYGWLKAEVLDFAQDENTIFDKIRICYNANNSDQMAIYVHYSPNSVNGVGININAGTFSLTPVNFETDSLTWENIIEYNLGSSGLYINGQSYAKQINVCMKPSYMFGRASSLSDMEAYLTANQNGVACCGSQQITDGPDGNTWYNFMYIPHRDGVGDDNYQFGCLLLFNMTTVTNNMWICHLIAGTWYPPQKISA